MDWAKRALRRHSETAEDGASTGMEGQPWATTINGMGGCRKNTWPKFAWKKKMPMAISDNKTTEKEEEEAGWEESAASSIISGKRQKN